MTDIEAQIAALDSVIHALADKTPNEGSRLVMRLIQISDLLNALNQPQIDDFMSAFQNEAKHQIARWGEQQDNYPEHFILVFNKLLGKLAIDFWDRKGEKWQHHLITIAAVAYNAHRQMERDNSETARHFTPQPGAEQTSANSLDSSPGGSFQEEPFPEFPPPQPESIK